jgi:hypothetical protein
MRMICSLLVITLLLLSPRVWAMKLIAPGVGWAERSSRLYWTTDDGANWKDITPPTGPRERIADIFFLDTHRGWALLAGDKRVPGDPGGEAQFALACTTDAGANWSITHVTLPLKVFVTLENHVSDDMGDYVLDYKAGPITFVDPFHGWMGIQGGQSGRTMSSFWSVLLVTSEGGQTWNLAPDSPTLRDPEMLLARPNEGWMVDGQDSEKLYVTCDGAKSWGEVSLEAPKEILPADQAAYDLPVFEDNKRGFVAVNYSRDSRFQSAAVLWATVNGGRTWKVDRILKNLEPGKFRGKMRSAVASSTWITATMFNRRPTLSTLGPGAKITTLTFLLAPTGGVASNLVNSALFLQHRVGS